MTYAPKPGSKAEAMVAALSRCDGLTTQQLATAGNASNAHVHGLMATAIKHGVVAKVRIDGQLWWRWTGGAPSSPMPQWPVPAAPDVEQELTTAPEVAACDEDSLEDSFAACQWSDGDLDIFGAEQIEQNGIAGVRLSADQVKRLRMLLEPVTGRISASEPAAPRRRSLSQLRQYWLSEFQEIGHAARESVRAIRGNRS